MKEDPLFKGRKTRLALAALFAAIFTLAGVGVASALTTSSNGTFTDQQHYVTNDTAFVVPAATPSGTWVTVPGMVQSFTIPAGTTRLIDARYTAEAQCTGGSWCSARVLLVMPSGATQELAPASGADFAFASPGGSTWNGNAMERVSATFLPEGSYRIAVQIAKVGGVTTYRVDDMAFAVELVRP